MSKNHHSSSIRELYHRFIASTDACSREALSQLRADPRKGAQKIYRQLKRKQSMNLEETRRLDRMLEPERRFWNAGVLHVAGVDEAGIGPLAGPVVAAAVVFSAETRILGINDSKRLTEERRSVLRLDIQRNAVSVSVGISQVEEIDRLNVYQAGLLAMRRAVDGLSVEPGQVLVDGRVIPGLSKPQERLVKGDQRSFAIAAASIIAKTRRDEIMQALDIEYPGYGFATHKGYPTEAHRRALQRIGPAAPHRRSFSPIRKLSKGLFDDLPPSPGVV